MKGEQKDWISIRKNVEMEDAAGKALEEKFLLG